jgi:hypothetical protein
MPVQVPTTDPITHFISLHHLGDYSSVIGIPLALIGLWITYQAAKKAKTEATDAKNAVARLRETLGLVDTVAELTAATSLMEEIKRLHRAGAWSVVVDRYPALRARLITINSDISPLNDAQRGILQATVVQLREIENEVERAVARGAIPKNAPNYNPVVAEQLDKMITVLTEIRKRIGEAP